MKSSPKSSVNAKIHKVKVKPKEEQGKLMNDPTLEGKDENKVGRIQRKTCQSDNGFKLYKASCSVPTEESTHPERYQRSSCCITTTS
jgi:uncharacterized protein YjbJ (UPF0337 family)